MRILLLVVTLFGGCKDDTIAPDSGTPDTDGVEDQDGDGHPDAEDCDDDDPEVHPDAEEACNDEDDDCDGEVDEGIVETWYVDRDEDGYGDDELSQDSCDELQGMSTAGGDCNDGDEAVHPGADELCDGVDQDCDGELDEEAIDEVVLYADGDGDGFATEDGERITACPGTEGYAEAAGDCDDGDASRYPGASEVCDGVDNDCDDTTSEEGLVALDGVDGYGSIQEALDAAVAGSEVELCEGIYIETLDISESVTLAGAGSASTTLDARSGGSAIIVREGVSLTLSGLTITGGTGSPHALVSALSGGAVLAVQADELVFTDVVMEDNSGEWGGAMFVWEAGLISFDAVVIDGNDADEWGGGLYLLEVDELVASATELTDNSAQHGGGAVLAEVELVELDGVTVDGNQATGDGDSAWAGGIWAEFVDVVCTDTTVSGNRASSVVDNGAAGGLLLYDATWTGGTIEDNEAAYGAGLFAYNSGTAGAPGLSGITVQDNTASAWGGGFYAQGDLDCEDSTVADNTAEAAGGGALQTSTGSTATLDGGGTCVLTGNEATHGGGLLLYEDLGRIDAVDLELSGNEASWGGGLYTYGGDADGLVIDGNVGFTGGGGVYSIGEAVLEDSSVSANEAEYGAGFAIDEGELELDGVTVDSNAADEAGGGALLFSGATLTSYDSDWSSGAADNSPEDIAGDGAEDTWDYGSGEDFSCTVSTALGEAGDTGGEPSLVAELACSAL